MTRLPLVACLALLAFALLELTSHVLARRAVPSEREWHEAAAVVRKALQGRDLITSAPSYTDPLLRRVLGDRIDLAMAGRSDSSAYQRMWSISSRGARPGEAPLRAPDFEQAVGKLRVQRWDLGSSPVRLDLTTKLPSAEVAVGKTACPWRKLGPARGGGLGFGALAPEERFQCERGGPWVARVVLEDLSLSPRACVMQPPGVRTPTRVRLPAVTLGDRIVVYAGLYYEDERMRRGPPVTLRVLSGERVLGTMKHHDGDGWKKLVLDTATERHEERDLSFEVSAKERKKRSFCWAASVREGRER